MKLPELSLRSVALTLFFALMMTGLAFSGTLTGTVVDNFYLNPVQDVEVSVFHSDSALAAMDTTNANGVYELILDAGEYFAIFSKENYADTTISDIIITPDGTTTISLTFRFTHNCYYFVGDVNGSSSYNGLDVTYGSSYFKWGLNPPANCLCECTPGHIWYVCGDVNGDCVYNGYDITYAVTIYYGGPMPVPCPDCPPVE